MLQHFPTPIILAHRGDLTHAPENTLPAFSQAITKGADGIELDAKLTADGEVIVFHDMTVDRTTNGKGKVALFTLNEIRKLDAGTWFDAKFANTKVPLLEEVFETVGKNKLINIELTNYSTKNDGLTKKVCELIKKHNNQKQIIFSSFLASNLKIAENIFPEIPRGLLAMPSLIGLWARSFGFMFGEYQALHPHISDVSKEQVNRVHRLKRRVHVWTANTPEEITRLKDWGIDGIFTDDPALAVQTLSRK
ncbi:MAG: putative glycerophosphoryl diester phosphodiesterase [Chloroflexi bacterium OLB14]|nr:MAG: putative glycerophosphoryl diester phosphodiesterase [Chloroflexi bacterium OLB14]